MMRDPGTKNRPYDQLKITSTKNNGKLARHLLEVYFLFKVGACDVGYGLSFPVFMCKTRLSNNMIGSTTPFIPVALKY